MKHLYPQPSAWTRLSAGGLTYLCVWTKTNLGTSDMGKVKQRTELLSVTRRSARDVCTSASTGMTGWSFPLWRCQAAWSCNAAQMLLESQWTARESQTAGNEKGTGDIRHWKAPASWPYQSFSWDFAGKEIQVEFCQSETSQTLLERQMHGTWCWLGAAQYTIEEACSLTTWSTEGPKRKIETTNSGQWKAVTEQKWADYFMKGIATGQVWAFLVCVCSWQFISTFKSLLRLYRVFIH